MNLNGISYADDINYKSNGMNELNQLLDEDTNSNVKTTNNININEHNEIIEDNKDNKKNNIYITIICAGVLLLRTVKYSEEIKKEKFYDKYKKREEYKSLNDIPDKYITSGELVFLKNSYENSLRKLDMVKVLSVTILELINKKYIYIEKHPEGKDNLYLCVKRIDRKDITQEEINMLKRHEKIIYQMLYDFTTMQNNRINIKDLSNKVSSCRWKYKRIFDSIEINLKIEQENENNYSESNFNLRNRYSGKQILNAFGVLVIFLLAIIIKNKYLLFNIIICIINYILIDIIINKLEMLTIKGKKEYMLWSEYKNYLNNFSREYKGEFETDILENNIIFSIVFENEKNLINEYLIKYPSELKNLDYYIGTYLYYVFNDDINLITLLNSQILKMYNKVIYLI